MKKKKITSLLFVTVVTIICILSCSTSNEMYRINSIKKCIENGCSKAVIEEHNNSNEDYALTFIEFSERGNVFSREKLNEVLDYIKQEEAKEKENNNGVMVIVYAHGWKHNASNETGDVEKFRKALKKISQVNKLNNISDRKVIGVYLGWRGLSVDFPLLENLTYWGRKNVARQLGSGGVTEVLVKLNKIVYQEADYNNVLAISGHSLGGAVILSAMKDILLSRLINTEKVIGGSCNKIPYKFRKRCGGECYQTKAFADSIVLLNPAVEANELLQLKEIISEERCYAKSQPKLLHILSSDSDMVTNRIFPLGQFLGISLQVSETTLKRDIFNGDPTRDGKENKKKKVLIDECKLDILTIGNHKLFYSGKYDENGTYTSCYGDGRCLDNNSSNNFPVSPFEPISVISVDEEKIHGHSDISNDFILAYTTTAVIENQAKKTDKVKKEMAFCWQERHGRKIFNFGFCVKQFQEIYKNILKEKNTTTEE